MCMLHAIIETNPDAIDIARKSDEGRKHGENTWVSKDQDAQGRKIDLSRPFHGMPFLVKDMPCTLDKMKISGKLFKLGSS